MIVAKIHNAHYTKPVQPWEIGPYARTKQEMNLELEDVAGLLKGFQGVTVRVAAAGELSSADSSPAGPLAGGQPAETADREGAAPDLSSSETGQHAAPVGAELAETADREGAGREDRSVSDGKP